MRSIMAFIVLSYGIVALGMYYLFSRERCGCRVRVSHQRGYC